MNSEDKQNTSQRSHSKHTLAIHGILRKSDPIRTVKYVRNMYGLVYKLKHKVTSYEVDCLQQSGILIKPSIRYVCDWVEKFGWKRGRIDPGQSKWHDWTSED